MEFLDFRAEADAAVSVRLVADVYDARGAAHLLGGIPSHFRGHAQGRFDGHSHLQRSRRSEKEATTRDVQGFRKVLSFVRSYAQGAETKRCPKVEAGQLPTFGYFHFVLPREQDLARTFANFVEGASSVTESPERSSINPWMAKRYQYQPRVSGLQTNREDIRVTGMP